MRVLHTPSDVGNQAWSISTGERRLGITSRVLIYQRHFPGFGADVNLAFERRSLPGKAFAAIRALLWALRSFDVIHFYFATTFLPHNLDLPLLKLFRKKLFFTFQGCDIRPGSMCPAAQLSPEKHTHEAEAPQRARLQKLLSYAAKSYVLNPDLLVPSPTSSFLPYAVDVRAITPVQRSYTPGEEVVLFHAPSDRRVKGTDYIEQAVATLRKEGLRIKLDIAHNVSHDEVLARAAQAHLVIDQLLGGWYGAFAVEVMALGKPTLCYLEEQQVARVPFGKDIPLINVSPATLVEQLRSLLKNPASWDAIGKASRAYAERIHDPEHLAKGLLHDYQVALEQ